MSQRRSGRPASSPTSKVETGTVLVEPCCEPKGSVDPEARRVRAHTGRGPRKRRCGSRLRVGRVTIRCGPKSSEGREGNSVRAPIEREPRGQFGACPNRARAARAIRCGPQSSEGRDDKSLRAQIGRRTAREPHRKQIPSAWIARQSLMRAPGIRQRRWHGERPPAPPTAIRTQRDLKQEEELTPNAGRTKNKFFIHVSNQTKTTTA